MIALLLCAVSFASALEDYVTLNDLTKESGLPERLTMDVIREGHSVAKLDLQQNKRLNENALVYEAYSDNGEHRHVRRKTKPFTGLRFYHDKRNGAAVSVRCVESLDMKCRRSVEGYFKIGEDTFEIRPAEGHSTGRKRADIEDAGNLHIISRVAGSMPDQGKDEDIKYPIDYKDNGKSIISRRDSVKQNIPTEYAVEIIVTIDPYLWKKYLEKTEAQEGMTKEEATEYRLRRKLAHVINGVSLRYESIEDPDFNVYVTISSFRFYKTDDDSSLVPKGAVKYQEGEPYIDSEVYLKYLVEWQFCLTDLTDLTDLKHDDHIMVFTGCELYSVGNITDTDIAGIAWIGGACSFDRASLQEEGDYYTTTTVAAHELGHNLGSEHDGEGKSDDCNAEDLFIMAPSVSQLFAEEKYTVNPWRFSSCSIKAFKSFFQSESAQCLTDHGDYYDKGEWDKHNEMLPGELHTLDEQCKLINGDYSGFCLWDLSATDERICRHLNCIYKPKGYCSVHTPARGSPCGEPEDNKWCIDGKCVPKTKKQGPNVQLPTTRPPHKTTKSPKKEQAEECFTTVAQEYSGKVQVTISGKTCIPWAETIQDYPAYFPESTIAEASNYCRSPDNDTMPWCYYAHEKWEFCNIKKCKPESYECFQKTADMYMGTRNVTVFGYTCVSWESAAFSENFPDGSPAAASNYCRDPDATGQPWCFVESPPAETIWELCDIPKCE